MTEVKGERIISGQITETPSSDEAISAKLRAVRNQVYGIGATVVANAEIIEDKTLLGVAPVDLQSRRVTSSRLAGLNTSDSGSWASLVAHRSKRRKAA